MGLWANAKCFDAHIVTVSRRCNGKHLYTEPEAVVRWKNSADRFEVQAN